MEQSTKERHDPTAAEAVIKLLAETFPQCFAVHQARRRPIKVGIHKEILAALGDKVTDAELSQALRYYTSNKVYRARLLTGAWRYDLTQSVADRAAATLRAIDNKADNFYALLDGAEGCALCGPHSLAAANQRLALRRKLFKQEQ